MRRTSNLITTWVVFGLAWAAVARAQEQASKEAAPTAAPAASQPAPAEAVPTEAAPVQPAPESPEEAAESAPAKPPKAEPDAAEKPPEEPTRLDADAIAEWAKKLRARVREAGLWLTLGDICQVKQSKQDKLQGFGLVVDLEGVVRQKEKSEFGQELRSERTPAVGMPSLLRSARAPSTRLADLLDILNTPVGEGDLAAKVAELVEPDQLAMAAVTAAVPPEGARNGDRIDCEVRALGGKSITEGYLLPTRLSPPGPKMETPAAIAAGPIARESSYRSGPAKVAGGCLVQTDLCDEFVKDGKITLILNEEHAKFPVAQDVVNLINAEMGVAMKQPLAKALNNRLVEVTVPPSFAEDPVAFVTLILRLETQIAAPQQEAEEPRFRFGAPGRLD